MEEKGVKIISLHTSGHADEKDFDKLIKKVEPKIIIPVHTENSEWFKRYENYEVICDVQFATQSIECYFLHLKKISI